MNSSGENPWHNVLAWTPHAFVAVGLAIAWLVPGSVGTAVMYIGFVIYGVFGIAISIARKYYVDVSLKTFKFLTQIAIVILAMLALVAEVPTLVWILMLVVMDNILLTRSRIDSSYVD